MRINDFGSEILAQSRPANTTAADAYSPATGRRAILSGLVICNTTVLAATGSVFIHASGNTKDQTTAFLYAKSIAANDYLEIQFDDGIALPDAGTVGVQQGTASALTFNILGRELDAL